MSTKSFRSLPLKTALTSFIAVFLLVFTMLALQVSLEFKSQNRLIEQKTEDITRHAENLLVEVSSNVNDAQQLLYKLSSYDFFTHMAVFHGDNLIAETSNVIPTSDTLWFTRLITSEKNVIKLPFANTNILQLESHKDVLLKPFFEESREKIISTMLSTLILSVVIFAVYYFLLMRPLSQLVRSFSVFNRQTVSTKKLSHLQHHKNDELGSIVDSANCLLNSFNSKHLELQEQQEQLSLILDASPNQVFAVDADGELLFYNQSFKRFFGNLNTNNYFLLLNEANIKEAEQIGSIIKYICKDQLPSYGMRQHFTGGDDEIHIMQMSLVPFVTDKLRYVIVVLNDISSLVKAEQRVEYLAYRDMLTGLPNRNKILEQLEDDIKEAEFRDQYGAVVLIDLNDFKRINDTMGHSLGDELLIDVSRRMAGRVRAQETLARIGADVFLLSIPNLADSVDEAKACAENVVKWLLETIGQPVTVKNQEFLLSATLGIALFPVGKVSVEILLSQADTALTEAKKGTDQNFYFFEPEMAIIASQLLQLENDVNHAFQQKDFLFHLQPLIDMQDHSLVGAEALIRWTHPERGDVGADDIIRSLEKTDMINPVSFQLLDNVCSFIRKHKDANRFPDYLRIAVNISERQLHDADFVGKSLAILEKHKLPGSCMEFEITERAALQNIEDVIEKMRKLQAFGITFALDDFGTGYSSLSYLKRLPVNKIKIDKSFIDDIAIDPQDAAMVSSIITIARNLNLTIVAEGVETEAQAEWLKQYGEILIQGHLYDPSMSESTFATKYLPEFSTFIQ